MNRVHLGLAGLQVLSLVAIGWLWSENRSLRTHGDGGRDVDREAARNSPAHEERLSAQREVGSSPKLGTRNENPGTPRSNPRVTGPEAGTRRSTPVARQGPAPVGSIGRLEKDLPADEPSLPETARLAAPPSGVPSLIVNGGFDGELAPWLCDEGRVIQDPADERNSLLEVTLGESGFHLSQSFVPPAEKASMTLSFRAMLSADTGLSGFDLMLLGQDDKPLVMTFVEAGKPGEWKKIELKGSLPVAPAALRIGSSRGEGVVWIDDVRLEQSAAVPAPPRDQDSP
jgi:hypothetical protein